MRLRDLPHEKRVLARLLIKLRDLDKWYNHPHVHVRHIYEDGELKGITYDATPEMLEEFKTIQKDIRRLRAEYARQRKAAQEKSNEPASTDPQDHRAKAN